MSPEIITGLAQGGAVFLLALVLWGISKKIDTVLIIANDIAVRLLGLIEINVKDAATRTQEVNQEKIPPTIPKV